MSQPLTPDPVWHQRVSFVKSGLRFAGYAALALGSLAPAATLLIFAELLGVAEEI